MDLHDLPTFKDKFGYIYIEHAIIKQKNNAIVSHNKDEFLTLPIANLAVLMLGPGTSITHEAIKTIADNNCLIVWCGTKGIRLYGFANGGSRSSKNIVTQAKLVSDDISRLKVAINMYKYRFNEEIGCDETILKLRGKEGNRIRQFYVDMAKEYGIDWKGRDYNPNNWGNTNSINRLISIANTCLYGIVHAAILSSGFSPALGFIHTGDQRSFVYDIADLYKTKITIPTAFEVLSSNGPNAEKTIRTILSDKFHKSNLLKTIIEDIYLVLNIAEIEIATKIDYQPMLWDMEEEKNNIPLRKLLRRSKW